MKRIILVDDDKTLRELIALFLERSGYVVHPASDGSEALRLYAQHPDSIVVMDMIMPGMEGIETILALRRLHPEASIIAISGGGRVSEISVLKIAAHIGARACLAKPFHPNELVSTIERVLNSKPNRQLP